jgi:capsular polysaccharide biosynthesis protein
MASSGPDELVKQAIAAVTAGDHAQAEGFCRQALEFGEVGEAYYILGFITLQQGRYDEAIGNCSRAVALEAGGWHAHLLLGAAHSALGHLGPAHTALTAAVRQNPGSVEASLRLLDVTVALAGLPAAQATYTELMAPLENPEIDSGWVQMGGELVARPVGVLVSQETALAWARRSGVEVLDAGEVEAIPIQTIGADAPTSYVMGNTPYVVDLPDVQVFAYSHMVLTADGVALNEAGGHTEYGHFVDHRSDAAVAGHENGKLRLKLDDFEMQDLDEGIWLAGPASNHFGHWIGEFAPRLEFLEQHPAFAGRPIIVDEGMPASHLEILGMICSNPVVTLRRGQGLRVRRLLYAPTPTFFVIHLLANDMPPFVACCASVRSYRFLKDKMEKALGVAPPTGARYYLSRANRDWRRIRNEDEVRSYLESHGYQTVMTEDLTFAEQVRLFQSAAAIMAPSGSAMQNFIFSPPDVGLFVLTQANLHNHAAFNGQARALGYQPHFICGVAIDAAQKHSDYMIPIDALAPAVG